MPKDKKKKRIMRSLKINEISSVDFPAQKGATVVLMKRDTDKIAKHEGPVVLTSAIEGHAHLISPKEGGGETSWNSGDPQEGHTHPWVVGPNGMIEIGESLGHTHTVESTSLLAALMNDSGDSEGEGETEVEATVVFMRDSDAPIPVRCTTDLKHAALCLGSTPDPKVVEFLKKRADELGDSVMLDDLLKAASQTKEDSTVTDAEKVAKEAADKLQKAQDELAIAKAFGELTDAQKQHHASLDDAGKTAFMAKSADDRATELAKLGEQNPVVFTTESGEEFRKNDDPRLVRLAKEAEEDRKTAKADRAKAERLEISKRAEKSIPSLPGNEDVHVALLKAVDGIKDEETRKAAHAALVAGSTAIAKAMVVAGHSGASEVLSGSPEAQLNALAKTKAEKDGVTFAKAYTDVCETPEGKRLYAESLQS